MGEIYFEGISARTLSELANALKTGRLGWPPSAVALRARGYTDGVERLLEGLGALLLRFPEGTLAALALEMLASERANWEKAQRDRLDLVWSGPEGAAESRDTAVVAAELFASAKRKVIASTYNLGKPEILHGLVENKRKNPGLEVKLFVHIDAKLMERKMRSGEDAVSAFQRYFKAECWRNAAMPAVYYDPRNLQGKEYAVLHAKCIVVDEEVAFVTSANFSEPAHNQNIEAGVVVRDPAFARALGRQFESLVERGDLERVV